MKANRPDLSCQPRISLVCLLFGAIFLTAAITTAQTFTTLKSFGILSNVSGFSPNAPLIQGADGTLYGTAREGEANVRGTVFRIQPDGSGFAVLKWFTNATDGAEPLAPLVLSGSMLYGVTGAGGSSGAGVVFRLSTNGTGYTVLKEFGGVGSDGQPYSGLALSGSVLFGTTTGGGNFSLGTVFKLNTDGTGFTLLKDFAGSDGSSPYSVTASGGVLYGATLAGGSSDKGTVFRLNTDGTGYAMLKEFAGTNGSMPTTLAISGTVLYGAAYEGGSSGNGLVFKLSTDGTGFTILKEFSATVFDSNSNPTNYEGAMPGPLTLSAGVLYGVTFSGGERGAGTVFKLDVDGADFTVLEQLTYDQAGFGLLVSNNIIFGATRVGGPQGGGTLFKLNTDGTDFTMFKEFLGDLDGKLPVALTISGNYLFGVTREGGANRTGTIFKLNLDGTEYSLLKEFGTATCDGFICTNSDGIEPSRLIANGNVLYGTARRGGHSGSGVVFRMNTDGTGFSILRNFSVLNATTNSDGAFPVGGVTLVDGVLYGAASEGGNSGYGIIFKMQTNGTGFTVLKHFTGVDGTAPSSGLMVSNNVIYGTTLAGGLAGNGTLFKLNTDGGGFATLKSFSASSYDPVSGWFTNSDGLQPLSELALGGGVLYGTAMYGGISNNGTVFRLNIDGTGFSVLKHFAGSDGAGPIGGLTVSGNTLYGTTFSGGGQVADGTVFRLQTDGSGYTVLKRLNYFEMNYTIGRGPRSTMVFSGGALYGTTGEGGVFGKGTVFKLELGVPLTIQPAQNAAVLRWNDPWFTLQSAPSPAGMFTNVPGAASPYTNTLVGSQQFFRLIGN